MKDTEKGSRSSWREPFNSDAGLNPGKGEGREEDRV